MEDQKTIYIADDEPNIRRIIESFLLKEGFFVESFSSGDALLARFRMKPADLLVLDVMMPGLDGFSLTDFIRSNSTVPIIIVSAKDLETDRINGLTLGCDDYLTKPFSPLELIARIKSLFRRIDLDKKRDPVEPSLVHYMDLEMNIRLYTAKVHGTELSLTKMEIAFLAYLLRNPDRAVSRTELLDKLWGFETEVETRATDDMVKRLRKKLANAGSEIKIETIWGFGFKLGGPHEI